MKLNDQQFEKKFGVKKDVLAPLNIDLNMLQDIVVDHEKHMAALESSAREAAFSLKLCPRVHSVSWRVKDPVKLLKKIVRKKKDIHELQLKLDALKLDGDNAGIEKVDANLAKLEKWSSISVDNYYEVVTDLVGVRALHIFVDGCLEIDRYIQGTWHLAPEEPVLIFSADAAFEYASAIPNSINLHHQKGYRSIHYILQDESKKKRVLKWEVQVRTIFQEGWGEVDHTLNYPEASDEADVQRFLKLFSATAGNADAMGTFAQELIGSLAKVRKDHTDELASSNQQLEDIKKKLKSMGGDRRTIAEVQESVESIMQDVNKLENSLKSARSGHQALDAVFGTDGYNMYDSAINEWLKIGPKEIAVKEYMAKMNEEQRIIIEALEKYNFGKKPKR